VLICIRVALVLRTFFLTQRATHFRQSDILELTDSLPRNSKLLTNFFEGLRSAALQCEPLEDYSPLSVVKNFQQVVHLVAQVFVAEQFERSMRILVFDSFTQFNRIIIVNWGI
jgi:hypothetical protein